VYIVSYIADVQVITFDVIAEHGNTESAEAWCTLCHTLL